jgi:two-component system response regulator FixJ
MAVERPSSSTAAAKRVYVIDDDPAMLESTMFLLDSVGIPSKPFSDPIEFLHALKTLEPGCVLTDFRMPTMTGIELHEALAARKVRWPVIVMSGHSNANEEEPMQDGGIFDFIEKPFTLDRLSGALKRAFRELRGDPVQGSAVSAG